MSAVFGFVFSLNSWALPPVNSADQKKIYIEELQEQISASQKAESLIKELGDEAKSKYMTTSQLIGSSPNAVKAAELSIGITCDVDLVLNIGRLQFKWSRFHQTYRSFAEGVAKTLSEDAVTNPFAWYQRFDFRAVSHSYVEIQSLFERDSRQLLESTCAGLREKVFPRVMAVAQKMDEVAAEIAKVDASDLPEEEKKRRINELNQEKVELEARAGALKLEANLAQRVAAVKIKEVAEASIEKMKALKLPTRGVVKSLSPKRLRLDSGRKISFRVYGENLPQFLTNSDVQFPETLKVERVISSRQMVAIVVMVEQIPENGVYTFTLAGEPINFTVDKDAPAEESQEKPEPKPNAPSITKPDPDHGTLLTAYDLGEAAQQLSGLWEYENREKPSDVRFFVFHPSPSGKGLVMTFEGVEPIRSDDIHDGLRVLQGAPPVGLVGQFEQQESSLLYSGLLSTVEKIVEGREPKCPQYAWWNASQLEFDPEFLHAKIPVQAREHGEDCEQTESPDPLELKLKRVSRISFKEVHPSGAYIHTLTVVAPGAYQMAVKLGWDYSDLNADAVEIKVNKTETFFTGTSRQASEKVFVSNAPGIFEFQVRVLREGKEIHTERALALLDR